jgi:non-heme chloroperoxidase
VPRKNLHRASQSTRRSFLKSTGVTAAGLSAATGVRAATHLKAPRPRSVKAADYLETQDGAKIYYEDHGEGRPILLVHGWLCSSKFWQKNVPELANEFRVVTIDLRGHGNSSKVLAGHTIRQYARDVREVIEHLRLQDAVLVGWSLGGPVVLSYYQQYGRNSRLKALGLVDCAPFPFSPADWNSHALRNYSYDGMNATFAVYTADPRKFAAAFTGRMFKQTPPDAEADWIIVEMMKTPTWIAEAVYSDFLMSDLAKTLPAVKVPVIVFAANSGVFRNGIAMGEAIAGQAPHGTFIPFEDAGHMLFYEQPQKFNGALATFIKAL